MTDPVDSAPQTDPTPAPTGPLIHVLSQYIKDLSFENPGANVQERPNIELGIDVGATPKNPDEGLYEVSLKLKARAGTEDTALFLLELDYSGMFKVQGVGGPALEALLLIECPRILFPFARRIIADISAEGGFPPLRVDPVDFASLYQAQRKDAPMASQNTAQE